MRLPLQSFSSLNQTQRHGAAHLNRSRHTQPRDQTHSVAALNTPNMLVNTILVSSYLFTLYNICNKVKQLRPVALLWGEAGKRDLSIKILNKVSTCS